VSLNSATYTKFPNAACENRRLIFSQILPMD
jgi:hypothetical protein